MVKNAESGVWEIRINGPHNESLFFLPLQRRVRGEFDLARETEPLAQMLRNGWPNPLPGQRIGVDPVNKTGYIFDPISDHEPTRRKIEAKGWQAPPVREEFPNIDVATWVHHMKRAIEAGLAYTVKGVVPAVEGTPRLSFFRSRRESSNDRLADALNRIAERIG